MQEFEDFLLKVDVHLFGAVSSPGVANFCLRKTAETGREQYGDVAADFLCEDFYVDDGLKSLPTVEDAIKVIENSKAMCSAARLTPQVCKQQKRSSGSSSGRRPGERSERLGSPHRRLTDSNLLEPIGVWSPTLSVSTSN